MKKLDKRNRYHLSNLFKEARKEKSDCFSLKIKSELCGYIYCLLVNEKITTEQYRSLFDAIYK